MSGGGQAGIDDGQFAAVTQGQVADQQGILWLKLTADDVGVGHRQLYTFGAVDVEAAEGRQFSADAAPDMRVGYELCLPVERLRAAWVEVRDTFLDQRQLILIVGVLGAIVDALQQHDVGLFVTDDPRHFIQIVGKVFMGRAFVRAAAVGHVIPEYIAFTRQVLDVPGHDFQRLPRHQFRCLDRRVAAGRE